MSAVGCKQPTLDEVLFFPMSFMPLVKLIVKLIVKLRLSLTTCSSPYPELILRLTEYGVRRGCEMR